MVPFASSAPKVMLPSVRMTGSTRLPSGMRATLLKRKIADSKDLKKSRAPAKKKLPAFQQVLSSAAMFTEKFHLGFFLARGFLKLMICLPADLCHCILTRLASHVQSMRRAKVHSCLIAEVLQTCGSARLKMMSMSPGKTLVLQSFGAQSFV